MIYDNIKAELGDGPPYPNRITFTTYYGYKTGVVIGQFATAQEALAAGATTTEKSLDEKAFRAANNAYRLHQQRLGEAFYARLRAEHPDLSDAVFALVYGKAYEDGHSAGFQEVELYVNTIADFACQIMAAA